MLRHIVMFTFTPGTTEAQITAIEEGLGTLPPLMPGMRDYRYGRDIGVNEGNFDFAVVGDFETREAYLAYRDHPVHLQVQVERIRPLLAQRAAVQFEL